MSDFALHQSASREDSILDGYSRMAADTDRETEGEEWSEGLIGDALSTSDEENPTLPSKYQSRMGPRCH